MKNKIFLLTLLIFSQLVAAQNFNGAWSGLLQLPGAELHLVFNVSNNNATYLTTLDSPDQGAKDIAVTTTTVTNSTIKFEIPAGKLSYQGTLKNDTIVGMFSQNGLNLKLTLTKNNAITAEPARIQEPKPPFDYYTEEIVFENKNQKNKLAGTYSRPKKEGKYPVVILISGSGPQNRDEALFGHKPFLVLADYLTKHGIAVLRYDDRGVGKSTGDFKTATSADFAADVTSAIDYLKTRTDVDTKKIGLVGHSEGGLIAPMVAAKNKEVQFIVLLAGPALKGDKLLLLQKEKIEKSIGISDNEIEKGQRIFSELYKIMATNKDNEAIATYLTNLKDAGFTKNQIDAIVNQLNSPWMRFYINYDPKRALLQTKCALFALNGENDLQVPFRENLDQIHAIMSQTKNKNVKLKSYPKLNHLFQTSVTGSIAEYKTIDETIAPQVLQDIYEWIDTQIK